MFMDKGREKQSAGTWRSGVSFGKKMEDAVDVGGIAYMAEIEFEIEIVLDTLGFQREGLTIRQMIDDGLY